MWRDTEVVITERSWKPSYGNVPWVRIPLSPPFFIFQLTLPMEKYSSWWRGAPAKGVGRVTGARVRVSPSPPKIDKSRQRFVDFAYYLFTIHFSLKQKVDFGKVISNSEKWGSKVSVSPTKYKNIESSTPSTAYPKYLFFGLISSKLSFQKKQKRAFIF